jgi:hypothetical protein
MQSRLPQDSPIEDKSDKTHFEMEEEEDEDNIHMRKPKISQMAIISLIFRHKWKFILFICIFAWLIWRLFIRSEGSEHIMKREPGPYESYVALCIAARSQSLDLKEFLIHHYNHIGIRRFYIMDDGSLPPLSEFSDYGIPKSAITFVYFSAAERRLGMQMFVYDECIRRFGVRHIWMGFIDVDEFIELPSNETLVYFLHTFESPLIGAVGGNWQVHTSSGLLTRPESARKAFTTCIADIETGENRHIKSFVRTDFYESPTTPHSFKTIGKTSTVGENGDIVPFAFRIPITRKRLAIHHYEIKSRAEFAEKLARGNALDDPRGWSLWDNLENMEHVNCTSMAKYNP